MSVLNLSDLRSRPIKKITSFNRQSRNQLDERYLDELKDQYSYQTKQVVREGKSIYINLYDSGKRELLLQADGQKRTISTSSREESRLTNETQQKKTLKYIEEQNRFENQKEKVRKNVIDRMFQAYNNAFKQLKPGQDAKYITSQIEKYKKYLKFRPQTPKEEKRKKLIQENRKNILNKNHLVIKKSKRAATQDTQERGFHSNFEQTLSTSQENMNEEEQKKKAGGLSYYSRLAEKLKKRAHQLDSSFKQMSQEDNQESILRRIRDKQQQLMSQPDSGYSKEVIQQLKSDFIQILEMSRIENYINL